VRIVEPWLWRSRGWCKVEANVAGYAGSDQNSRTSVLLPVAPRDTALAVLHRVFPEVDVSRIPLTGVPAVARWCDPVTYRFLSAGADDKVFVTRRGRFRRETDVVPHERVQSARLTQGALQRRLGLATLHLDTVPGPVHATAHHRRATEARRMLDVEVELARRSRASARPERWMTPPPAASGPTVIR
jgi:putative membrane protein